MMINHSLTRRGNWGVWNFGGHERECFVSSYRAMFKCSKWQKEIVRCSKKYEITEFVPGSLDPRPITGVGWAQTRNTCSLFIAGRRFQNKSNICDFTPKFKKIKTNFFPSILWYKNTLKIVVVFFVKRPIKPLGKILRTQKTSCQNHVPSRSYKSLKFEFVCSRISPL